MTMITLTTLITLFSGILYFRSYFSKTDMLIKGYEQELRKTQRELDLFKTKQPISETPEMRVLIKIDDPLELANSENPLAKTVGKVAPNFITQKVYKQVKAEAIKDFETRGINATVDVITI